MVIMWDYVATADEIIIWQLFMINSLVFRKRHGDIAPCLTLILESRTCTFVFPNTEGHVWEGAGNRSQLCATSVSQHAA